MIDPKFRAEAELFDGFRQAFGDGEKDFILEDLDDGSLERGWMRWSEEQGWVTWQVRLTCDHQCRLGKLTEQGQRILAQAKTGRHHGLW
ncbi:MAG: hypothetical protein HQL75_17390 [Magnetococcales bacterium]|nr:hypothetical protein [Magnetococcales bacterium]